MRDLFLLEPGLHFLNHGSFGAVPRPVFDEYQRLQREVEAQPVRFIGREADDRLAEARGVLATYLHCPADDLLFVPNTTAGLNMVIRGLSLQPGDEILGTDHEYGALDATWNYVCERTGARYLRHPIPVPVETSDTIVDAFWAGVTPRTRVIFLSHITSPTALTLPVAAICRRARQAGILTIIDGAHVPGHLPLDLAALDADAYAGNCHKWLCAPRGSAFLWVRPGLQPSVAPMTVSHGWRPGASYQECHTWQGTRDLCAFLTVPAAIAFQRDHDWDAARARCHELARQARRRVADLTGLPPLSPDSTAWFGQMVTLPLPPVDLGRLKQRLYDEHQVEAPIINWGGRHAIRLSFQGYNDAADLDAAVQGLAALLPQLRAES
ncbi:MAG: aminotransferase class V-fold PLP-dependent enzyme [Chloroflexi bacterium]|nr:aminotransferase class V-fold PLP-dependent enzyme [Chloroflexota bacterium]